jgi:hypothetical protein
MGGDRQALHDATGNNRTEQKASSEKKMMEKKRI